MAWQDDIAEKRREAQEKQAVLAQHKENIAAVTGSGKSIEKATDKLAKSADIDKLLQQMKEVAVAQYMSGQGQKPSIVLTDQTDLGDKFEDLANKLTSTVAKLDTTDFNSKQLQELKAISLALAQYRTAQSKGDDATQAALTKLAKAVSSLKLDPTITVAAPKVTVPAPVVNLEPLQETIKQYFRPPETEKFDLECYRAQDIIDGKDMQYVGFVNPEGHWYIIENDVKGGKMRYVFGKTDYEAAFAKAAMYNYLVLNEAIHAAEA